MNWCMSSPLTDQIVSKVDLYRKTAKESEREKRSVSLYQFIIMCVLYITCKCVFL